MTAAIYLNGATLMTTPTQRVALIAREAGYGGIEARAERLLRDADEVRATAATVRPGEVFSLNGVALRLRPDGQVNGEMLEADLSALLHICTEIGAPYLLAIAPRAPGIPTSHAIRGTRESLELARDQAGAAGIRLGFEFLGFDDCPINTPALAAETVSGIDGIWLVLDSCHWHASGGGPLGGYPIGRLALVHLNDAPAKPRFELEDSDRLMPGDGVIDLHGLLDDLEQGGYPGPWSLETFNPAYWQEDPRAVASRGMAAMERIVRDGQASSHRT